MAQRPARIDPTARRCPVPMSPTAYRRVTCSLQVMTPPPAVGQWPMPLPPAPPPRGAPHPPLPIQTPVFFDLFVRCSVTALERITLRGFCSRLRCAQLGWRPRFARLPSGHPGRIGDLSAVVGALPSSHRTSVLPSVALR